MPKTTKKPARKMASKMASKPVNNRVQEIEKKAKVVAKKANSLAKKNPWALAGISAGLGLAVGLLTPRGKGGAKKKK